MVYSTILQRAEVPVSEDWRWQTDAIQSDDGSEQTIALSDYPKRTFKGTMEFDDVKDVRRHMAAMFGSFRGLFDLPLFQYGVPLKANVQAGANTVYVNCRRSELRTGKLALLIEGATFELVTINVVSLDNFTVVGALVNSYSKRANVVPITQAYSAATANFSRRNPDGSAKAGFQFNEYAPTVPFVNPLNEAVVPTFDDLPLLDKNSIGSEFESTLETGIEVSELPGLPDIRSRWNNSKWTFQRKFKCNRVTDLDDWEFWQAFADTIKGGWKPFLLPTFRSDFAIHTAAVGAGNQVTLVGDEYSEHYAGIDAFSRIVIESEAGRHFAKIDAVVDVAGNDRLTFSPALPAGAGWNVEQSVSLLLKVRIGNDTVAIEHYPLSSVIDLSLRTVD